MERERGSALKRVERITAYTVLALLLATLLPVMYLGRYNYPTGDDYYYGVFPRLAWEETGSLTQTLAEAVRGVAYEYNNWQGTYSAMFLMHLPPIVFSFRAYGWVTTVLLLLLTGSLFYLLKPILCGFLQGSRELWVAVSGVIALLWVQTVPSQGETFFWYNGSMYYTGFFAVTCFYFGLLARYLQRGGAWRAAVLMLLSVFLAGGNYVSLLPTILLMVCLTVMLALKNRSPKAWCTGINGFLLLFFLGVSAMAPGNQVRQSDMWKIPAWKAVAKSLLQGLRYARAWIGIWWLAAALLLVPLFWIHYKRTDFQFRYPLLVIGFVYGIFCSMSCPTFYTMNSTGPARAVAIVYYGFILATFFCLYYLAGWVCRKLEQRRHKASAEGGRVWKMQGWAYLAVPAAVGILLAVQLATGAFGNCTTVKAVGLLADGRAAAYGREQEARLALLREDSEREVILQPFENQPDMLYVGDLSSDPEQVTNQKVAMFFHKEAVSVAPCR